jgi:glyoxylase-like metal-dependent hydrolase (beta-lactamase superfamily II)
MKQLRRLLLTLPLLAAASGCATRIPKARGIARVAPRAPATAVSACWLEFGKSLGFTASGLLVHHPRGDVLIDAGQSQHFSDELKDPSVDARWYLGLVPGALVGPAPASTIVREAGVDPTTLRWFIPTHVHSDHVGGLMDLPDVPILLPRAEMDWLSRALRPAEGHAPFNVLPTHARRMAAHLHEAAFDPTPYETFPAQHDVFQDGALVLVLLAGHTPGSTGVFVNAPPVRLFYVGDAINELSAMESLRGKAAYLARTDADPARANRVVAELEALHEQLPSLTILPAHERKTWEALFGRPAGCVGRSAPAP